MENAATGLALVHLGEIEVRAQRHLFNACNLNNGIVLSREGATTGLAGWSLVSGRGCCSKHWVQPVSRVQALWAAGIFTPVGGPTKMASCPPD